MIETKTMSKWISELSNEAQFTMAYRDLLQRSKALFYATPKYLRFLEKVTGGKAWSVCLYDDLSQSKMIGAIPFVMKNGQHGTVVNSLPFFGSNPGMIIDPDYPQAEVAKYLIDAFQGVSRKFFSSTIIQRPFEDPVLYENGQWSYIDQSRVAMRTKLKTTETDLIFSFHGKTKNLIRKAYRVGVKVKRVRDLSSLKIIERLHVINMTAIGAPVKPPMFFDWVRDCRLEPETFIAVAWYEKGIVAGLIGFIYGETFEYFMPVVDHAYRNVAPMNLLIYESMLILQEMGIMYWNWGGTNRATMESVYHFKKRFAAEEQVYKYYTKIEEQSFDFPVSQKALNDDYKYFFIAPYSQTISCQGSDILFLKREG